MLIGILKSFFYMFLFLFILRIFGYIFRFIYFYFGKRFTASNDKTNDSNALKMLQCEKCKTYVVKSEAYIKNGRVFCKPDHFF